MLMIKLINGVANWPSVSILSEIVRKLFILKMTTQPSLGFFPDLKTFKGKGLSSYIKRAKFSSKLLLTAIFLKMSKQALCAQGDWYWFLK